MSLLKRIRELIEDPRIIIHDISWSYSDRVSNNNREGYFWEFTLAPRDGFNRIDSDSISELAKLQTKVFGCLREEDETYKPSPLFEGIILYSHVGVHPMELPGRVPWAQDIFYPGGCNVIEPVGIRESWKHESVYIIPEFKDEFSSFGANHLQSENSFHNRTVISRNINVTLYPSIEYLRVLDEILKKRNALFKTIDDDEKRHEMYRVLSKKKNEIGFYEVGKIIISKYNAFFGEKK